MFRILLWCIGGEYWHFIALLLQWFPALQRFNPTVVYFAFGANLAPGVLQNRHIQPIRQRDFILNDHELLFNQPGPYKGFGFASVHAASGKQVFGRLILMRRVDEIRMDYFELVPFLKRHRKITHTQDGETFFFYQATQPLDGLRPTAEYLDKIMQAVEKSTLIPEPLRQEMRRIQPLETLQPTTDRTFLIQLNKNWPSWLQALATWYDVACRRFMMRLYRLQLCQRLLH